MPANVPTGPWRKRAQWLAWSGLLFAVVLAWRADLFEPRLNGQRDSDRLRSLLEALSLGPASDYKQTDQFRTQIGDERFIRALRKLLSQRPTEFRLSLAERWEKNPLRLSPELHQAVSHRLMQADFELMQPENLAFRELGLVAHLGSAAESLLPELIETVNEPHYSFSAAAALLVLRERAAPAVLEAIGQGRVSRYDELIPGRCWRSTPKASDRPGNWSDCSAAPIPSASRSCRFSVPRPSAGLNWPPTIGPCCGPPIVKW
ncbi:MAG TPA: hypothetical protein VMB21_14700 [Candidatus Limnocylindria bacterium]|nr:hypothetical protein [Candidatus Limnocylindria bacterium]